MIIRTASLLVLLPVLLGGTIKPAFPQATSQTNQNISTFQFNPPDSGLPDNTTGGASRNPNLCRRQANATQASNLTLLVPSSFLGLTVSDHPSLFIYAEQTIARQLFISLQDDQGEPLYQGFQALPTNNGLIRFELPSDAPNLETDRTYRFSVVAVCEESLRPDDPVMTAYVKRISLPQSNVSESPISSFDQAALYADLGIWYDTLSLLSQELRKEPENQVFITAWESLLIAGELSSLGESISSH